MARQIRSCRGKHKSLPGIARTQARGRASAGILRVLCSGAIGTGSVVTAGRRVGGTAPEHWRSAHTCQVNRRNFERGLDPARRALDYHDGTNRVARGVVVNAGSKSAAIEDVLRNTSGQRWYGCSSPRTQEHIERGT